MCAAEIRERELILPSGFFGSSACLDNFNNFSQDINPGNKYQVIDLPSRGQNTLLGHRFGNTKQPGRYQAEIEQMPTESVLKNAVFKRLTQGMSAARTNDLASRLVKQPENLTKDFETIVNCLTRDIIDEKIMNGEGRYQAIAALTNVAPEHLYTFVCAVRQIPLPQRAQWMRHLSTVRPDEYQNEIDRAFLQKKATSPVRQKENNTRESDWQYLSTTANQKRHDIRGLDYEQLNKATAINQDTIEQDGQMWLSPNYPPVSQLYYQHGASQKNHSSTVNHSASNQDTLEQDGQMWLNLNVGQ